MKNKLYSIEFNHFIFEVWNDKPNFPFKEIHQIHSKDIISFSEATNSIKADGISFTFEDLKESAIAIKTADCMPIVVWNDTQGIFLHAGWKGLSLGILKNFNFRPTHAFIGPSICAESFEVTSEFQEHFPNSPLISSNNKLFFDLKTEAFEILKKNDKNISVEDSKVCTLQNLEYNSFRRNKTNIRNYNIIRFKGLTDDK